MLSGVFFVYVVPVVLCHPKLSVQLLLMNVVACERYYVCAVGGRYGCPS